MEIRFNLKIDADFSFVYFRFSIAVLFVIIFWNNYFF